MSDEFPTGVDPTSQPELFTVDDYKLHIALDGSCALDLISVGTVVARIRLDTGTADALADHLTRRRSIVDQERQRFNQKRH